MQLAARHEACCDRDGMEPTNARITRVLACVLSLAACGGSSHSAGDGGTAGEAGLRPSCGPDGPRWSAAGDGLGATEDMAVDASGGVYAFVPLAGVLAFDERGERRWFRPLPGAAPRSGKGLVVSPGGDILVLTGLESAVRVGEAEVGPGRGVVSLTPAGELRWFVELEGDLHGVAAPSADRATVLRDHAGQREVVALGEDHGVRWRTSLEEVPSSGSAGVTIAASPGGRLAVSWPGFVGALNVDGELLFRGVVPAREVHDVAIDAAGRVAVVGSFSGSPDFGGGDLGPSAQFDAYVAVYDPDGSHRWSRALSSSSFDYAYGAVFTPDGGLIVTGHFGEGGGLRSDLDVGGDDPLVSVDNDRDLFLAAYDGDGELRWATRVGSRGDVVGRTVGVGPCGRVVVGGFFVTEVELEGTVLERADPDTRFTPFVWQTTVR